MKLLRNISSWLKNKYLLAVVVFAAIMLFFDKNDLFTQMARTRQLKQLQESRAYYTARIATEQKELDNLRSNPGTVERYAREMYLMKRENEDLFILSEKPEKANN
jgi:cell division protein DivIC